MLQILDMPKSWKMEGSLILFYLFLQKKWSVPTRINQNMALNCRNKRGNMKVLLCDTARSSLWSWKSTVSPLATDTLSCPLYEQRNSHHSQAKSFSLSSRVSFLLNYLPKLHFQTSSAQRKWLKHLVWEGEKGRGTIPFTATCWIGLAVLWHRPLVKQKSTSFRSQTQKLLPAAQSQRLPCNPHFTHRKGKKPLLISQP